MIAKRFATHAVTGCAAACVIVLAGHAHAAVAIADSFEPVAPTFTITTPAFRDCGAAHTGSCSVHVPASIGATRRGATLAASIPLTGPVVTSFAFMAASTSGDMDADVIIHFDSGDVRLHLTEGAGSNTGVSLYSATQATSFTSWTTANAWNSFGLVIDPAANTATATLLGRGSATVSIPGAATRITRIELSGINWGSGAAVYFDSFAMAVS